MLFPISRRPHRPHQARGPVRDSASGRIAARSSPVLLPKISTMKLSHSVICPRTSSRHLRTLMTDFFLQMWKSGLVPELLPYSLSSPSVSSIETPHGSTIIAVAMPFISGVSAVYGRVGLIPFASSALQNASRFLTSNPT